LTRFNEYQFPENEQKPKSGYDEFRSTFILFWITNEEHPFKKKRCV